MSKFTLKGLNNYVVFNMYEQHSETVGAIELSGNTQKVPRWGTITSVGPGVPDFNGTLVVPDVKVGDIAYVTAHGQHEIKTFAFGGEEDFHVASVLDVLTIVEDLENMTLQPLGSYIEIEKLEAKEHKIGELFVPDVQQFPPNIGKVKKVGIGWKNANGSNIPFQVKEGDLVAYDPFAEMTIDLTPLGKEETRFLIMHGDIFAILESEEE